jgi:putative transposase
MKKTRVTEEQMVTILREADERSVPEVAKKHSVSAQTIYAWRKHFGSLEADVKRLRQLEQENQRLKKMVADRDLELDVLKEITRTMVGVRVRRQQVAYAEGRGLSRRRACALLSVARSTVGYVSRLVARDASVVTPMRTLAAQYPRYGYRTIRILLERQGHALGTDRMYRLWRQAGLQVPQKRPRRRVAANRPRPLPPTAMNHVWAYDFVFDTCADGRTLKCLTVIDEFTRECLAIDVAGEIRSGRVIDVLAQLVSVGSSH